MTTATPSARPDPTAAPDPWWTHAGTIAPAVVLMVGVAVYGLLSAAYDKYYAELGLTPADLGVLYGRTLGGAAVGAIAFTLVTAAIAMAIQVVSHRQRHPATTPAGKLAWALVALVLLSEIALLALAIVNGLLVGLLLIVSWACVWWVSTSTSVGETSRLSPRTPFVIGAAAGVAWISLLTLADFAADELADRVKDGRWVQTPESGGLVMFSVRAMPVTRLTATGDSASNRRFAERHRQSRLMFLGTANGMLIMYDATRQQSLLLPSDQFRAPVVNCETDKMDEHPLCRAP